MSPAPSTSIGTPSGVGVAGAWGGRSRARSPDHVASSRTLMQRPRDSPLPASGFPAHMLSY